MRSEAAIFHDYLSRKASEFDALIVRDMQETDSWIGTVTYGEVTPDWFEAREIVRKLVEGDCYEAEEFISEKPFNFFESREPLI